MNQQFQLSLGSLEDPRACKWPTPIMLPFSSLLKDAHLIDIHIVAAWSSMHEDSQRRKRSGWMWNNSQHSSAAVLYIFVMYTQRWWKWLSRDELGLSGALSLSVISLFLCISVHVLFKLHAKKQTTIICWNGLHLLLSSCRLLHFLYCITYAGAHFLVTTKVFFHCFTFQMSFVQLSFTPAHVSELTTSKTQPDQHLRRAARGTTPTCRLIRTVFLLVFSRLMVVSSAEKRSSM